MGDNGLVTACRDCGKTEEAHRWKEIGLLPDGAPVYPSSYSGICDSFIAPIPPETTTAMPPCLWYVYERGLGWPGRPEDFRPDNPSKTRVDPAQAFAIGRGRRA